jgi:hypothetical protein
MIARFYAWKVLPYCSDMPWGPRDVWEHILKHGVNFVAIGLDTLDRLHEYNDLYSATAVRVDPDGNQLAPDFNTLRGHLAVMRDRMVYAEKLRNYVGRQKG